MLVPSFLLRFCVKNKGGLFNEFLGWTEANLFADASIVSKLNKPVSIFLGPSFSFPRCIESSLFLRAL